MYDRKIDGEILEFEASGSLYHSALVMQDNQTMSYWALMSHKAIGGPMEGAGLVELPIGEKTTWGEWKRKHPKTLALSVDGAEHVEANPYDNYFNSEKTFRPAVKPDGRLSPKASIFTFNLDQRAFALPHEKAAGGWVGPAGKSRVFIYRPETASIYRSTVAFALVHEGEPVELSRQEGQWRSPKWGLLSPETGAFEKGGVQLRKLAGLDTFWYIWSQYHPDGALLAP